MSYISSLQDLEMMGNNYYLEIHGKITMIKGHKRQIDNNLIIYGFQYE